MGHLGSPTISQTEHNALRPQGFRGSSNLNIELQLSFVHFNDGRLILQCVAVIASVYHEVAELELGSVRHPIPARVSAPSSTGMRFSAEIRHTIQLLAYSVLLAFVVSQT